MMISFTYDRQVLEFAKNDDQFLLVYPNTPAGRTAAKRRRTGVAAQLRTRLQSRRRADAVQGHRRGSLSPAL